MSEAQSIMRPTILPSLLDIASHNVAHGAADVAHLRVGRRLPAGRAAAADEHHALAALLTGAATAPSWADVRAAGGRLLHRQGAGRGRPARGSGPVTFTPCGEWPFLHPGRSAEVAIAGDAARASWARCTRSWPPSGTSRHIRSASSRSISASSSPRHRRRSPTTDVTTFPAVRQDLAVVVDEAVPSAECAALVRDSPEAAAARSSTSTAAPSSARARNRSPCTASSRRRTAP